MKCTLLGFWTVLLLFTFSHAQSQTATAPAIGTGTAADPYRIATLDNLYWISQNSAQWVAGKYFIQTADIDATTTNNWFFNGSQYLGWPVIGGNSQAIGNHVTGTFAGSYDGQGYTISNLYMRRTPEFVAMFGNCTNAILKNITLVSPQVFVNASGSTGGNTGGNAILMASGSATISNVHIRTGSVTTVAPYNNTGGMLGRVGAVTVSNSSAAVTISTNTGNAGSGAGGFVAYVESATASFTNCFSTGTFSVTAASGANTVGGFVGATTSGTYTFTGCYSTVNVTATMASVGGFIGSVLGTGNTISNCYARGNVSGTTAGGFTGNATGSGSSIVRCYATGSVTGGTSGGFGGAASTHTYTACFWDQTTSGKTAAFGSGTSTGVTGRTTAQMKTQTTFTNSPASWDFVGETTNGTNDYWFLATAANNGYPALVGRIRQWTGATNNIWSTSTNWLYGFAPTSNSIVKLSSTLKLPSLNADVTVDILSFEGVSHKLNIAGFTLTANQVLAYGANSYIQTPGSTGLSINTPSGVLTAFPVGASSFNPLLISNNSGAADYFTVRIAADEVYANSLNGAVVTEPHITRTWDITKTNPNSGSGVNLEFAWNAGEVTGTVTAPSLYHYETTKWEKQSNAGTLYTNRYVSTGYVGTFSPFAVAQGNQVLPVSWRSFTAVKQGSKVSLKWATEQEINSKEFTVQHSTDQLSWSNLGVVAAAGNSNGLKQYAWLHGDPVTGLNYYRLVQRDINGAENNSRIVAVNVSGTADGLVVYPNPVLNGKLNVRVDKAGEIAIFNSNGIEVFRKNVPAGTSELILSLPGGVYHLKAGSKTVSFIVK